jgi:hypothetical protein
LIIVGTCQQLITVNDVEAPNITCPAGVIVSNDDGLCSAAVNYNAATAIDNCAIASVELTNGILSGDQFPIGSSTNTFTAIDFAGNDGKSFLFWKVSID